MHESVHPEFISKKDINGILLIYKCTIICVPDSSSFNSFGKSHNFIDIIGQNTSCQSVGTIVSSFNHFFHGTKLDDLLNRPKNLNKKK